MNADRVTQASETRNPNRTVERIHGLERDKRRRLIKLAKRGQRDQREMLAPLQLRSFEEWNAVNPERYEVAARYLTDPHGQQAELIERLCMSPQPGDIWGGRDPDEDRYAAWVLLEKDSETGTWLALRLRRQYCQRDCFRLAETEPCGSIVLEPRLVGIWQKLQWRIGFISAATLKDLRITYRRAGTFRAR